MNGRSSPPAPLFFYEGLVNQLSNQPQGLLLVQGGVGLGKTTFLKAFEKPWKLSENSRFLEGRRGSRALDDLEGLAAEPEPAAVYCIDDLDSIQPRRRDAKVIDKIEDALGKLKDAAEAGQSVLVATTTTLPDRLFTGSNGDVWSDILKNFKEVNLDPWPPGWAAQRQDQLKQKFGQDLQEGLLALWIAQILETSGGHPTLLGGCFRGLKRLLDQQASSTESPQDPSVELVQSLGGEPAEGIEEKIRLYLEDVLGERAAGTISRALRRLEESGHPADKEALVFLDRVSASGGESAAEIREHVVRRVLQATGLAHPRAGAASLRAVFEVSGEYIRQELRLRPSSPRESPMGQVGGSDRSITDPRHHPKAAVPEPPSRQGQVKIVRESESTGWVVGESSEARQEVPLRTSMWKALTFLQSREGKTVRHGELQAHLGLRKERAARSTIERLQKKLRNHKIFGLVETVWGQGYRLGSEPFWDAEAMDSAPKGSS